MKTLMIDFDGVLASYNGVFELAEPGAPNPGAVAAVKAYLAAGFRVMIHSSRAAKLEGRLAINKWLALHGLGDVADSIGITAFKVPAVVYLDDRGWRFSGEWPEPEQLERFQPWWQQSAI
jgi:hypothetical protein